LLRGLVAWQESGGESEVKTGQRFPQSPSRFRLGKALGDMAGVHPPVKERYQGRVVGRTGGRTMPATVSRVGRGSSRSKDHRFSH
jgi:hypothetical protein